MGRIKGRWGKMLLEAANSETIQGVTLSLAPRLLLPQIQSRAGRHPMARLAPPQLLDISANPVAGAWAA